MLLECTDLKKSYSNKCVVDKINLSLEQGRIYALLGQNGSGKSTLMKMIAGLVNIEQGNITVQGMQVGVKTKGTVAYMPTEAYFYDYMKIEDVGKYYKDFYDDFNDEQYLNLINRLELNPKDRVKHLSSGEMAKLKLAATLAREAKLFLLDEPLNGIDLITREIITTTILEVSREDNTIVIASHLINEIEMIVDHVIFLDKGKVSLIGDAEEIREQYGKSIVDLYRELLA